MRRDTTFFFLKFYCTVSFTQKVHDPGTIALVNEDDDK